MICIYCAQSGAIKRVLSGPLHCAQENCLSGESWFEVPLGVTDETHFVVNGGLVPFPPKPSPHHTFNYATKQWEPDPVLAAQLALSKRAQLLVASDWTQLPDVPLETKEAWAVYRQALRDITEQPGYPLDVVWPSPPA